MLTRIKLFALFFFVVGLCYGQKSPKIDSSHMLLLNPYIQVAATQGLNDLYNFKFKKSLESFQFLKYDYGWHPLPYFLMGLNYWWRILPNLNNEEYDEIFKSYMDTTLFLAKRLVDLNVNVIEGYFFLAAGYAFRARLYSDRNKFLAAAFDGKKSLKYLEVSRKYTTYSPELLFGEGIINYYSKWIRENYPMLKPLMLFMPEGDMELGLKQLLDVGRNAFYARTEAQYYLLGILYYDANKYQEAMQLSEYLHQTYPDNSYFHKMYARLLYIRGFREQAEKECSEIMDKISQNMPGYEANTGRYAAYFLGLIYKDQQKLDTAEIYFLKAEIFAETALQTDKGYYFETLNNLAYIAHKNGDNEKAKSYYKKVKKLAKRKHYSWKRAKIGLEKM